MRVCRLGACQLTCLASQLETEQHTKGLTGLGLPTTNRNTDMVRNSARTQRLLSRVVLMPCPWGRAVVLSALLLWLLCS